MAAAVVETVAEELNTDPTKLDPLYEYVDTEALDSIFHPGNTVNGSVSFDYSGCNVTVTEDGEVSVEL